MKEDFKEIAIMALFALGFLLAPFVGVGILMILEMLPFKIGNKSIVFGGSIAVYLLLYMGIWFLLKKKGSIKFGFPF